MARQGAFPSSWSNLERIKAEEAYRKQMREAYPEQVKGSRAYGDHVTGRNNMTDFSMPRPYRDVRGAAAGQQEDRHPSPQGRPESFGPRTERGEDYWAHTDPWRGAQRAQVPSKPPGTFFGGPSLQLFAMAL